MKFNIKNLTDKNYLINLFKSILEYIGILKVIVDIGNEEIRIMEIIRILFFYKILSIKNEKIYDSDRISFFLERFIEKNKSHNIKRIKLSLSNTSIIPIFLKFPEIPKEKLHNAIMWEIEKNIPIPIEESYHNYKIISKTIEEGKFYWNVIAVVARKEEIDKYLETFKKMNILVEQIIYLPLTILHLVKFENSENAIGYIHVDNNSIELYIVLKKKIIKFEHIIGVFSKGLNVALINIKDFFAEFIRKRLAFLEKILVISKNEEYQIELVQSLLESLNIVTFPLSNEQIVNKFKRLWDQGLDLDLTGIVYKNEFSIDFSPPYIKQQYFQDRLIRALVLIFFTLNVISFSFYIKILSETENYEIIKQAKKISPEEITHENIYLDEVYSMAKKLQDIKKLEELKKTQQELMKKIQEAKSSGIESSNLKIVLAELANLIPDQVWLKNLTMNNNIIEIQGLSENNKELENFLVGLVNSNLLNNVILKKAEYIKSDKKTLVNFIISFGVSK